MASSGSPSPDPKSVADFKAALARQRDAEALRRSETKRRNRLLGLMVFTALNLLLVLGLFSAVMALYLRDKVVHVQGIGFHLALLCSGGAGIALLVGIIARRKDIGPAWFAFGAGMATLAILMYLTLLIAA